MNQTYSITSKGQITLPKELRDAVGLKPGGKAKIMQLDAHTIAIKSPLSAEEVRRLVGPPANDQPLTASEQRNLKARGLL